MKIVCTADNHFTDKIPRNRTDDYVKAQFRKFAEILKASKGVVICAGDLFDSAKCPYWITKRLIELLRQYGTTLYAVVGQHDLRYHNKREYDNTPFAILESAGVLIKLGGVPVFVQDVRLYGAGWEEGIPKKNDSSGVHILVTHRMMIKDKKVWEGQSEYSVAKKFLGDNKFDIVVSGDNHQHFIETYNNKKMLINPGSMMRMSSAQMEHKPSYVILDTENKTAKRVMFPVEENVFDLENIKKQGQKKDNKALMEFVAQLKTKGSKAPNFLHVLNELVEKSESSDGVRKFIDDLLEEIK